MSSNPAVPDFSGVFTIASLAAKLIVPDSFGSDDSKVRFSLLLIKPFTLDYKVAGKTS
jgi:hypothetical protein